jgi:guanylate kinase
MSIGKLFVISAPSGTGKTTLLRKLIASTAGIGFSISHTTRSARPGEKDGVDYHFVAADTFNMMVKNGEFLEHATVHTHSYGTSRRSVEEQLAIGNDVILDIDVQGAGLLRRNDLLATSYVFIAPPSLTALEQRLRGRMTEQEEMIKTRLANAREELQAIDRYDYLVVNDRFDDALQVLSSIIIAERAKGRRSPTGKLINLELAT